MVVGHAQRRMAGMVAMAALDVHFLISGAVAYAALERLRGLFKLHLLDREEAIASLRASNII
jgi:hypothetical protein